MAEKILNSYETIFIIDENVDEETKTALQSKFISLIEANGTVETPYGRLSAQWTRCDGFMKASVVLPEGITMKIRFKGKEILFAEKGEHCIYIPCK